MNMVESPADWGADVGMVTVMLHFVDAGSRLTTLSKVVFTRQYHLLSPTVRSRMGKRAQPLAADESRPC
jgi:hypothetical protein